jgi:putative tryptophan/tyrosine transport system substrate-binding protein
MKIIGILNSGSPDSVGEQFAAFHRGLEEAGYVDGENVVVEYYWANNDYERTLPELARSLAGRGDVAVIVAAGGTVSARAAKEATAAKPVVFTAVTDPVNSGLNVPNLTGMHALTSELDSKRLELLHEFKPAATRIGVLAHKRRHRHPEQREILERKARDLGLDPVRLDVQNEGEIDQALQSVAVSRFDALLVTADPFFNSQRAKVIAGVARLRVPAIYQWSGFVAAGGLMSYGPRITDAYRQAGVYAGRILAGTALSDLRVVRPTRFEMVINFDKANTFGGVRPELLTSAFKRPVELPPNAEIVVTLRSEASVAAP